MRTVDQLLGRKVALGVTREFAPLITGILTLPLFFSGFAFSTELDRAPSVSVALSSNLLGAMVGGLVEYNSLYFGFRSLYYGAAVMYALAYVFSIWQWKRA